MLDENGVEYIGFNFDARKDIEENKKNIELIRQALPESLKEKPQKYYILPTFHKGNPIISRYKSIEDFLKNPYDFDDNIYLDDILGITTKDLLIQIIGMQNSESFINEMENEEIADNITRVIDKNVRFNILREQKWRCNNCATRLKFDNKSDWAGEIAHIDHIFPFSNRVNYPKGAININERQNLQALCPKCNLTKHKNIN